MRMIHRTTKIKESEFYVALTHDVVTFTYSFSQTITSTNVSMSVSCLMSVFVSLLHRVSYTNMHAHTQTQSEGSTGILPSSRGTPTSSILLKRNIHHS